MLMGSPAPVFTSGPVYLLCRAYRHFAKFPPDSGVLLPPPLADFHFTRSGWILLIQASECPAGSETQPGLVPISQ